MSDVGVDLPSIVGGGFDAPAPGLTVRLTITPGVIVHLCTPGIVQLGTAGSREKFAVDNK